jgi:hypothetical protein
MRSVAMGRSRATAVAIAIMLSATVAGTTACAAVRNGLGTSSSVCFRAIPVGRAALTGSISLTSSVPPSTASPRSNTFVGVRSASQRDIDTFGAQHNYLHAELTKRNGGPIKSLCLVAFRGSFDPGSVHQLLGNVPPPGHRTFAVVVVSEPSNKVLATFLRSKEPISFTHYVVGG